MQLERQQAMRVCLPLIFTCTQLTNPIYPTGVYVYMWRAEPERAHINTYLHACIISLFCHVQDNTRVRILSSNHAHPMYYVYSL